MDLSPRRLYPLWDPAELGVRMAQRLNWPLGRLTQRQFPDGESYLRILDEDCQDQHVVLFAQLDQPDVKLTRLLFAAHQLRSMGAASVGLVAPYLPYMRQDQRFHAGEALSSVVFADLLSRAFDWLVTVDAHLHRYQSLEQIYSIPCINLSATQAQAEFLRRQAGQFCLVGPDEESAQWVQPLAAALGWPELVLVKQRNGDRDVEVALDPRGQTLDIAALSRCTPILVDDILSTGMTLKQAALTLQRLGFERPWCVVTHALFSDENRSLGEVSPPELDQLAARVLSCDSLHHRTNKIALDHVLALGVTDFLGSLPG